MKTKRAPTIRFKLVLLVMACVIPAAIMAVLLIAHDYDRARSQLLTNTLHTSRAMMSVVDRDLASMESSLVALATSPHIASGNLEAFYEQAQVVLQHQAGAGAGDINIAMLDRHGKQYINTRRPFGAALPVSTRIAGMQAIYETGKPTVSNLFVGEVARRPLIAVGVPVPDETIELNLNAGIFPERFERLLLQQKLPESWIAAIFDGDGRIIARTRDMKRYSGQMAMPEMVRRMKAAPEDMFESITYDGVPVQTVFSRSSVSSWTLAIGVPTEELTRELRQMLFGLVFATVFLLGGSIAGAWVIGGRIAGSIHDLTGPALALGSGEKVHVPPLHLREADEVAASLMRASEMLQHARHQANHDVLTGLANRALFNEIVNQQLALCERNEMPLSILYIDLDGFKVINDQHGHEAGDRLLCSVASRLKKGSRHSDLVARLGGDEFAIVMVDTGMNDSNIVAQKLVNSISEPYAFEGDRLQISASIGIASYPESGVTSEALLHRADRAMYQAKGAGRRRVVMATSG